MLAENTKQLFCLSLSADTHDGGVNIPPSAAGTSTSALYTSLSASPSSPGMATTALPVNFSLCECAQSVPLMAAEYGSSPPFTVNSEAEEVYSSEKGNWGDIQKSPLRKCMSETFANPSDESEADVMYTSKPTARVIKKKIHIPVKENKKYVSGTWHGVRDQRQPSSETKSNMSAAAKGHKRSQSDMGVGAMSTDDVSLVQDATFPFCSDAMKSPPASDLIEKTTQRSQRGKCLKLILFKQLHLQYMIVSFCLQIYLNILKNDYNHKRWTSV